MSPSNVEQYRLKTVSLSSLVKVFADEEPKSGLFRRATALSNETFSFQVAYYCNHLRKVVRVRTESELEPFITVREVGLVPAELLIYEGHDTNLLRTSPGLYPDPLYPIDPDRGVVGFPDQWRSVWVTVRLDGSVPAGIYPIRIVFLTSQNEELGAETFELDVLQHALPPQKLIHTEWFHSDCLSTHYATEAFSERHWELIDHYVDSFVRHGINMILTPIFTPPLDTQVGGERPTVQLIDVEILSPGHYRFGFERLERWIEIGDRRGIDYYEFSHLFTQWGAKHSPKIVANENGAERKIFGWETDATGAEYREFLSQFLPELVQFIKKNGLENRSYFHVSDEPHHTQREEYAAAAALIRQFLGEFPIIDALSDIEFYEQGLIEKPVAATDCVQPFLDREVPDLWVYYCCSQYKRVANRFICMPSARSRILGMQLYKHKIAGFLQWGFNFWYAQYSLFPIDPYKNTDSNHGFPAGDGFVVYPGEDGRPVESLRFEVLFEALQDLRALQLLESLIGREATVQLMEEGAEAPMTFEEYPQGETWLLHCRERINQAIKEFR